MMGLAVLRNQAVENEKQSPSSNAAGQALFLGKWVTESGSGMIYELDIRSTDQGLVVHYWFDEGRGLRDSGELLSEMSDNNLVSSKDMGWSETRNTHSLTGDGKLNLLIEKFYTDNSGRKDYSRTYTLKQVSPTPTLSGPPPAVKKTGKIKKSIEGVVLGLDGVPEDGAEIMLEWRFYNGRLRRESEVRTTTDKQGKFSLPVFYQSGKPLTLIVKNLDQTEGAIYKSHPNDDEKVQINLEKTVEIKVQLEVNGTTSVDAGGWPGIHLRSHEDGIRLSSVWGRYGGAFTFHLPKGNYRLETGDYSSANGKVFNRISKNLKLDGSKESVDLGIINVTTKEPITLVRKGVQAPDWYITDARGISTSAKLEDLKGKWVLLDFWGYWCGPCIRKMPELIHFYEEFESERNKFEVLAFHSFDVHEFKYLDLQMKDIIEKNFKGKKIPFPVVLDSTRKTTNRYHVSAYPTMILINPEGIIENIGNDSLDILRKELK